MGKLSCSNTDMYRGPSTSGVCQIGLKTNHIRACRSFAPQESLVIHDAGFTRFGNIAPPCKPFLHVKLCNVPIWLWVQILSVSDTYRTLNAGLAQKCVTGLMGGGGALYAAERLEALKKTAAGYSRRSKPYQV